MNPFEMVVLIVAIVMVASIAKARYRAQHGIVEDEDGNQRIAADPALRGAINLHLRRAAVGLVNDYGDAIVSLVSDTVRKWDARTVTEKLETAVGRDLQFIRINGTIIGGTIGLVIHALRVAL